MNYTTLILWTLLAAWLILLARRFSFESSSKIKTQDVAIDALFIAIIAVMGFVPELGYLVIIPSLALTLMHLPVLIGAYLFGWKKGLIYGLAFGITSWLVALTQGTGLNAFFAFPWISVLPRVVWGFLAGLVFQLVKKTPKIYRNPVFIGLLSFLLTLLHSFLVFADLFVFYGGTMSAYFASTNPVASGTSLTFLAAVIVGAIGEATLAAIVVPVVGKGLLRARARKRL